VVTKSSIFWDITPCSPLKDNIRFEGTRRLQLQEKFILRLGTRYVPLKSRLTFKKLHGFISQKVEPFMNKLKKDSRCADRDSNQGLSDYEKRFCFSIDLQLDNQSFDLRKLCNTNLRELSLFIGYSTIHSLRKPDLEINSLCIFISDIFSHEICVCSPSYTDFSGQ
jgi:hypothetical protein